MSRFKSRIGELIPIYHGEYLLDVNIETNVHEKSTYFENIGLEQRWINVMRCAIRYQTEACNFTKINTPPWVFFKFLKLYKWYQICATHHKC